LFNPDVVPCVLFPCGTHRNGVLEVKHYIHNVHLTYHRIHSQRLANGFQGCPYRLQIPQQQTKTLGGFTMTTYDERGFALQATRLYEVHPTDFWLDDFNEYVTLIKVYRNGKVKIGVTTKSAIVGVRIMKVKANAFTWKEVI